MRISKSTITAVLAVIITVILASHACLCHASSVSPAEEAQDIIQAIQQIDDCSSTTCQITVSFGEGQAAVTVELEKEKEILTIRYGGNALVQYDKFGWPLYISGWNFNSDDKSTKKLERVRWLLGQSQAAIRKEANKKVWK